MKWRHKSDLNAKELNKKVGDSLVFLNNWKEINVTVSGIYQDITNGGRTAKARFPYDPKMVLWYVVALDVKPDISVGEKMDQYTNTFYPAKVTHLETYLSQTLGNTIKQLKIVILLAVTISISILILITSLFMKMLFAKDSIQIAIMKSIGFTIRDIRIQYLVRILLIAGFGIIVGVKAASVIGQNLV